jgi:hypothetical protein
MGRDDTKEEKNRKWNEWYHKVGYSGKNVRNARIRRLKIREWFQQYKETLKCSKCGESHIACLDFHHHDSSKKEVNISEAIWRGWSIKRIMEEIEKCDILCCKCHRILHYEESLKMEKSESVPELAEDKKPKYLGYSGNGIGPKPFKQTHTFLICEMCGKVFPRLNRTIKEQKRKGCVKSYCSRKCYIQSRNIDKEKLQ